MNTLNRLYQDPVLRQLPNMGGSYLAPPAPQYSPMGGPGTQEGGYTFDGLEKGWLRTTPSPVAEQPAPQAQQQQPQARNKYKNPKTGKWYTPEEYGNSIAMNIPVSKGTGDIGQYTVDAVTNPNESEADLTNRARVMNNTRNDIATGTTDPYKVGKDSGIAYSPEQLKAIESAYAGIYDPVLNDVFTRMKEKQDEKDRINKREDMIFATNESIRQWRATTGTKKTGDAEEGTVEDVFSDTQINKGVSASKMTRADFLDLDFALANYFVNPPVAAMIDDITGEIFYKPIQESMDELKQEVRDGVTTRKEAIQKIEDGKNTKEVIKAYLINQLPITAEDKDKDGFLTAGAKWLWNSVF